MCTFCPQDKLKEAYGKSEKYMSLDSFKKILSTVPPHVRIDFSGMAEPFANPETIDMIEHAFERGFLVVVYSTLYGLTDIDRLIKLIETYRNKFQVFGLHLPDDNGNMRGWKNSETYISVLQKLIDAAINKKTVPLNVMTMDMSGKVHRDLSIPNLNYNFFGLTRAGNLDESNVAGQTIIQTPQHHRPISCKSTPFYDHNVVLPNGDVVLCCMDYGKKHTLGNLLKSSYYELFVSSEKQKIYALNSLPIFSDEVLCKSCSSVKTYDINNEYWITND